MSALDRALVEFEGRLHQLRAWPDKRVIFEVTDFCGGSLHIASHLADILISRLVDPLTNVALKVPLFYLVDSVVKNVGGPYIELFSSHIVVAFQRIFAEVNDTDKARMDFLLSTWEEGMFFRRDLLRLMRTFIGRRIVCARHTPRGGPPARGLGLPPAGFRDRAPRDAGIPFPALVKQEMAKLLDLVYADMGVRDPLPLDDLSTANPQLFYKIKKDAEYNVQRWLDQENHHGPGGPRENFRGPDRIHGGGGPFPTSPGGLSIRAPRESGRRLPVGGAMSPGPGAKDHMKAFVAETVVSINMVQAEEVNNALTDWSDLAAMPDNERDQRLLALRAASLKVAKRLNGLMSTINVAPNLPPLLFDNTIQVAQQPAAPQMRPPGHAPPVGERPKVKPVMPPFVVDELKRNPKKALRALYTDRPFYSHQDGLRFKSQQVLMAHLDSLFVQNKEKKLREQSQGGGSGSTRNTRQWYLDADQWITDCGALGGGSAIVSKAAAATPSGDKHSEKDSGAPAVDDDEEMVVPADENFPRCPVSNEVFQTVWDDEEGDFMYRNAVKVLLTEDADAELYGVSQNTSQPGVRYALVHKRMALDGWIASGKAVSLKDAMILKKQNSEMADFAVAGNVDIDEEDVFVILPSNGESNGRSSGDANSSGVVAAESKMDIDYDPFSAEAKQ